MSALFSREAIRQTAWGTLIAVVFVVLLPLATNLSRAANATPDAVAFSTICTLGGAKIVLPNGGDNPDGQLTAHQQPCAFCSSIVPVFADADAPRVAAVIDGMPAVVPRYMAESLPPDLAATQPSSPRAPPRI